MPAFIRFYLIYYINANIIFRSLLEVQVFTYSNKSVYPRSKLYFSDNIENT